MNYDDLLNSHQRYGTTKDDIIRRRGYEQILENVVIAPWWEHTMFDSINFKIEQVNDKIYNYYSDDISFSFIELKSIGAPVILDNVLSLGVTKCKNLVFLGSAGSLDENLKIGDIVLPEYSICLDGASRFLNKNLEDEFLKKEYPSKDITNELIEIMKENNIEYKIVPNISIDTIFAQFYHIDKFIELGAKTIEMETACLFKCGNVLNINITALFNISDCTVANKSLYSGRTLEENNHRHNVRNNIFPKLVVELFKRMK